MNRVDAALNAWFQQTPGRKLALWLGAALFTAAMFFLLTVISGPATWKGWAFVIAAPFFFLYALYRAWRAYTEMRSA